MLGSSNHVTWAALPLSITCTVQPRYNCITEIAASRAPFSYPTIREHDKRDVSLCVGRLASRPWKKGGGGGSTFTKGSQLGPQHDSSRPLPGAHQDITQTHEDLDQGLTTTSSCQHSVGYLCGPTVFSTERLSSVGYRLIYMFTHAILRCSVRRTRAKPRGRPGTRY